MHVNNATKKGKLLMFSNVKYIMTDQMYVYTKKINLLHTACIALFIITYQLPSLL